jgi:hypothetical protein
VCVICSRETNRTVSTNVIGLLHRRSPTAGVKRVCRPWAEGTKAVSSEDTKAGGKWRQAERFNSQKAVRK